MDQYRMPGCYCDFMPDKADSVIMLQTKLSVVYVIDHVCSIGKIMLVGKHDHIMRHIVLECSDNIGHSPHSPPEVHWNMLLIHYGTLKSDVAEILIELQNLTFIIE